MALPVAQIMNQLQRGVREERIDVDDDDEEAMADVEDGAIVVQAEEEGEGERNFEDIELELIGGEREGTTWLVIDAVHICFMRKDRATKKTTAWECSGRRRLGCEFKIRTTNFEGPGALKVVTMSDTQIHSCSADKVAPLMQKFRLQLNKRMTEDLDVGWSKIWNEERSSLLGSLITLIFQMCPQIVCTRNCKITLFVLVKFCHNFFNVCIGKAFTQLELSCTSSSCVH